MEIVNAAVSMNETGSLAQHERALEIKKTDLRSAAL